MNYELMLVTNTEKGDSLLVRVEKVLKESSSNLKVERLGKKTLAYKIKKQADANYYVLSFEAEGSFVKPLTDKLRLEQEDLLRFLLLKKVEKKPRRKIRKVVEEVKEEPKDKPKVTVAVRSRASVKSTKVKSTKSTKEKSK
ncbi:MAG: 30S ribosomal protein S6 [Candidatus Curtissbacteria bacterium GW2011_GWA1_41_11]|uniref:Small ribosomal subunit protein bS6 n=1 Tax=Candidatus Curtissbacteria bacterium GW2011_GWA1_41_11 TaxID=1618409 RepID=A0A0G0WRE2_9BACT|nr:MAG: 30S ribosomal protein S6 [Candidatus Curtissbacteria bacterium GW2011_GWA1_41_11]